MQNCDLSTQLGQALGLITTAFDVTTCRALHLERTAENALATQKKVGRTIKMTAFPNNRRYLPHTNDDETPSQNITKIQKYPGRATKQESKPVRSIAIFF